MKGFFYCLLMSLVFLSSSVFSGVIPEASRLVYALDKSEQPLRLYNANEYPVVVQVWVNDGEVDGDASNAKSPMFVMPPVFKMGANDSQEIKIMHAEGNRGDKEIVYWLNIHEAPPSNFGVKESGQARFVMGMRTQMKIFYRPEGLKTTFQEVVNGLEFKLLNADGRWILQCKNNTPLHASFTDLGVAPMGEQDLSKVRLVNRELDMMTPPFSEKNYVLEGDGLSKILESDKLEVTFVLVDDFGADHLLKAPLNLR